MLSEDQWRKGFKALSYEPLLGMARTIEALDIMANWEPHRKEEFQQVADVLYKTTIDQYKEASS